eukprot:1008477-Amphidinium_carterae.1
MGSRSFARHAQPLDQTVKCQEHLNAHFYQLSMMLAMAYSLIETCGYIVVTACILSIVVAITVGTLEMIVGTEVWL